MKKIIVYLIPIILLNIHFILAQNLPITPLPQEIQNIEGEFNLSAGKYSIKTYGISSEDIEPLLTDFKNLIWKHYKIKIKDKQKKVLFHFGIADSSEYFKSLCKEFKVPTEVRGGNEAYILSIQKEKIIIAGNSSTSIFYGIQSLIQLLRGKAFSETISCVNIYDWPDFPVRGIMDDISRGPIPEFDYIKYQIRRYSELKLNTMSFYIEHVIKTKSHGDFAPAYGHLSIDDFAALSDYARKYHIELMGNFQSLGHAKNILKFPQYKHLGATERMFNPKSPELYDFLNDIYSEMAPAFSSKYFNVNCDEAWDLSRGNLNVDENEAILYANHINKLDSLVNNLGKQTIIWGDILLKYPEIMDLISNDIIVGSWEYGAKDSFSELIDPVKDHGFSYIVSPGILNSRRLFPDYTTSFTNIKNLCAEALEKESMGVMTTIWDDGGFHYFGWDWYGVGYAAEQSWNTNNEDISQYNTRFYAGIYADKSAAFADAVFELGKVKELAPTQEMNSAILWKKLLPDKEKKLFADLRDWDEIKRIASRADSLLNLSHLQRYQTDKEFLAFVIDEYLLLANSRFSIQKATENYANALHLQKNNKDEALYHIQTALDELEKVLKNLKKMKTEAVRLWLRENQMYWLDNLKLAWDSHLNDIQNAISYLEKTQWLLKHGYALPAPASLMLDINYISQNYFQYWLLAGSFKIEKQYGPKPDFLNESQKDIKIHPKPGDNFSLDGKNYHWMKFESREDASVNLKDIYDVNKTCVAYAYCTITSPDDRIVTAYLGSNDGIAVYCNDELIFEKYEKRSLILDEDKISLTLHPGKNYILLKIDQWKGDWGFSFRLDDVNIRNHKYKYSILQ